MVGQRMRICPETSSAAWSLLEAGRSVSDASVVHLQTRKSWTFRFAGKNEVRQLPWSPASVANASRKPARQVLEYRAKKRGNSSAMCSLNCPTPVTRPHFVILANQVGVKR